VQLAVDPQRMLADLRALAAFGQVDTGVDRRALSDIDMEARRWLVGRMEAAGLDARIDGVGNVIGKTAHARRILIGSHTDTVPNGGWLDGALGVICGLEIARCVQAQGGDVGVEVLSLSDEEGHFSALLGSRAFCDGFNAEAQGRARNAAGESLSEALDRSGLAGTAVARLDPQAHIAYLEAHIEQGPVLEVRGVEIGIVTHIVGLREYRVTFTGEANHAGTTPMSMRRDASAALLHFGARLDQACRALNGAYAVWNIGRLHSEPAASNVVSSLASCPVQFRSTEEGVLDQITAMVATQAAAAADEFDVQWSASLAVQVPVANLDPALTDQVELAAQDLQASTLRMPSGAGHDAMAFAAHLPTAMLFIPSEGGVSHSTAENSAEASLVQGLNVLARAVERISRAAQTGRTIA